MPPLKNFKMKYIGYCCWGRVYLKTHKSVGQMSDVPVNEHKSVGQMSEVPEMKIKKVSVKCLKMGM